MRGISFREEITDAADTKNIARLLFPYKTRETFRTTCIRKQDAINALTATRVFTEIFVRPSVLR